MDIHLNDIKKALIESGVDVGSTIIGEVFFDGIIGNILPGIPLAMLKYKQVRMERNFYGFLKALSRDLNKLQEKWETLNQDRKELIRNKFAGIICDYVADEKEVQKVEYMAAGFKYLVLNDYDDESIITEYYDIFERIRVKELRVLLDFYHNFTTVHCYPLDNDPVTMTKPKGNPKYLAQRQMSEDELFYILKKLASLNLLVNTYYEDDWISKIIDKLDDLIKHRETRMNFLVNRRAMLYMPTELFEPFMDFFFTEIIDIPFD